MKQLRVMGWSRKLLVFRPQHATDPLGGQLQQLAAVTCQRVRRRPIVVSSKIISRLGYECRFTDAMKFNAK